MKNKIDYIPGQFDEEEKLALEQFEKFASYFPKIYTSWTGTPSGNRVDAIGENMTGGCEYIELKKRSKSADKFEDCFIEPEKYDAMMAEWEERNCFPIYVNFIGDWKDVYVFYLPEVNSYKLYEGVKIRHQNGQYSREDRYGLKWTDAHHYQYDSETDNYKETPPVSPKIINKKARLLNA